MIQVYIECGGYAECVATVADEWTYMALLPAFEQLAISRNGILTESVVDPPTPISSTAYIVYGLDLHDDSTWLCGIYYSREKAEEVMEELTTAYKLDKSNQHLDWKYLIQEKPVS